MSMKDVVILLIRQIGQMNVTGAGIKIILIFLFPLYSGPLPIFVKTGPVSPNSEALFVFAIFNYLS